MEKELQALKIIGNREIGSNGRTIRYVFEEEYEIIKKSLTPPTAEEVCKALSEYLGREVLKDVDDNFYYSEHRQIGECDEIVCGYGWKGETFYEYKTISFEFDLPPHLITLIGKFYEALG